MNDRSRNRFVRRPLVIGALILAAATASWTTLRSRAEAPAPAPRAAAVPATLVQVAQENVPQLLTGVGTVQPLASVTVRTRLDGQLERIGFIEGQDVRAGQVLAELDGRALRAQLEQARAQKGRDTAQLDNARRDLERYTQLVREDAASHQTADTQRALVAQLQAAVQTDDAQIHYAEVQLGYATITAPISGRTGARQVDPGNIVHANDANGLVVINQIDPIAVVFTLPGDAVQAINRAGRDGRRPPVFAYDRSGDALLARGELVLVDNRIDMASGTVQLKARFANGEHELWPGQYVNVRLQLGEHEAALTLPASAVLRGQAGTYVYVVGTDGKAQMRPVDVVQIQDDKAVVGKGLAAGETVVADGQYRMKPGIAVVAAGRGADAGSRSDGR